MGRDLLGDELLTRVRKLLPDADRYQLKYLTFVLAEDGVDRQCLVSLLEFFGQLRDSGVSPLRILEEAKEKIGSVAKAVLACPVDEPLAVHGVQRQNALGGEQTTGKIVRAAGGKQSSSTRNKKSSAAIGGRSI
jgi:hypothetical protein